MKKKNRKKKTTKKIQNSETLKSSKRKNKNEIDLWKEIRTNLKPLVKAFNKFSDKRRIAKQREEDRRFKQNEKQRLREDEIIKLQEQENIRIEKQKKTKEEKERKLQAQTKQRLEEKKIKDDYDDRIRNEQILKERLIKGEQERINQLKRVNEARIEERKLREERYSDTESKIIVKRNPIELRLEDEEQRLKEKEQRLKEKEQRLKEKEQSLKEEKISDIDERLKNKRLNGTVLWFNDTKGYGFIKREDKEKDIFVHFSAVQNSGLDHLKEDEKLTFEIEYSDKGPTAINLQKTDNQILHSHLKVIK